MTVPQEMPTGEALFAWTWINREQVSRCTVPLDPHVIDCYIGVHHELCCCDNHQRRRRR